MSAVGQTLRIALRQLWKTPGFTLTVVLTLALGIGAATAVFSLVEGVLLRPLPFREPERLMLIGDHLGGRDGIGVTAKEIETYAATTTAFASVGGYAGKDYETRGGEANIPEELSGMRLTTGVFPTLGVEPLLGRVFTHAEEDGNRLVAVISYAMWLNRFHRDAAILGRTINLDSRSYTVIGVMPRNFEFPVQVGRLNHTELWVPMSLTPDERAEAHEGVWAYQMVARLKDGVTVQQAASDVDRVAQVISRNFPPSMAAVKIRGDAAPLREHVVGHVRPMLNVLLGAVGIVLLIACVNVAGLLLVRGDPAETRVCSAAGARCWGRKNFARISYGRDGSEPRRRIVGAGTRCRDHPGSVAPSARVDASDRSDRDQWDSCRICASVGDCDGRNVQFGASVCSDADGSHREPQTKLPEFDWHGEPRLAAIALGSSGDCNRAGATDVFRSVSAEL